MVYLLLEYGADPNTANDKDVAPLDLASGAGHLHVVELIVQCGAQINRVDNEGVCALVLAAQRGQLGVLEYLLAQDWNVDVMMEQQAVIASILQGHHEVMEI